MAIWQKIVVGLLVVGVLGGVIYFARIVSRPPGLSRLESIPWVSYEHPNVEKLKRARALDDDGKSREARELVVAALTAAPRSPVTQELRDLLGEINTRIFFSGEPSLRKVEYTVKHGDALSLIARKLKSSTDAIMRINKLDSTLIRPGEKLLVPRLDFTITIDVPRHRIVVHDSHGFFTEYPIAHADLPPSREPTRQMKVKAKLFWKNGRRVTRNRASPDEAVPRIYLGHVGYVLYSVEEGSETAGSEIEVEDDQSESEPNAPEKSRPPQGIAMLNEDIAQLELLIRKGTPVTLILDRSS